MNLKSHQKILEIYGIFRILLGTGQLVGLFFGYFLLEWVIHYPGTGRMTAINEEIFSLTYLAVFLRAPFHLIAGIGTACLQGWVRYWLFGGWPIVVMITTGCLSSLYHLWQTQGFIEHPGQFLSFPGLIIYGGMIFFDYIYINRQIARIELQQPASEAGPRWELRQMMAVVLIAAGIFSLLMFLGRPLRDGFYRGFYKKMGRLDQGEPTVVLKSSAIQEEKDKTTVRTGGDHKSDEPSVEAKRRVRLFEQDPDSDSHVIEQIKKGPTKSGMSYSILILVFSGLLIILAFFAQIAQIYQTKSTHDVSLSMYALLCFGFLLGTGYGVITQSWGITLFAFLVLIFSLIILGLKMRYR